MIKIQPIRVYPNTGEFIRFSDITITPKESAYATWQMLDATEKLIASGGVNMTHEQYIAWGTDDNYAETCFLENLGLIAEVI